MSTLIGLCKTILLGRSTEWYLRAKTSPITGGSGRLTGLTRRSPPSTGRRSGCRDWNNTRPIKSSSSRTPASGADGRHLSDSNIKFKQVRFWRLHYERMLSNYIWNDSSFHALSRVFWVESDQMKRLAINSCQSKITKDGATCSRSVFIYLRPNGSSRGLWLKSKVLAHVKSYRLM